jgi:GTPase Era involved in 16S rRNA processing
MRMIGSPKAGQSTLVNKTTGEVTIKPVRSGDEENDPNLIIIQGGREFYSTDPWLYEILEPYGAHYVEE